ncbi:MAG TPA: hypothetical protein VNX47_05920 [Nevskia sp.]|jgi:hypothetical protein|nr:hypothetical protein [Nevskia sp.]
MPTPPSSQAAGDCPIGFALMNNGQLVPNSFFNLIIRPEELNRTEPSRTNVRQTLGTPFVDEFGLGIARTSIQGHTGWRGSQALDGAALFVALHKNIYLQWHALRQQAKARGQDPDTVEAIFVDVLNGFSEVVAFEQFDLRRTRSRPLLFLYTIRMVSLRDASVVIPLNPQFTLAVDDPQPIPPLPPDSAFNVLAALSSARTTIATDLRGLITPAQGVVCDMAFAAGGMLDLVTSGSSLGIDAFNSITGPAIAASMAVEQASANLTEALVGGGDFTEQQKRLLRALYSNFQDACCTLANNFAPVIPAQYQDFTALFGASNCSSTTGGSPQSVYATSNPFLALFTSSPPPVVVNGALQGALTAANEDLLQLSQETQPYILGLAATIAAAIPQGTVAAGTAAPPQPVNPFQTTLPRCRRVNTLVGDTLLKVAARELQNAALWYQIAEINGLAPPYLTDDPEEAGPGVLLTGAGLLVPDNGAAVVGSSAADPVTAFGIDLLLTDGDITDDGAGDIATVSGNANLEQAITIKLNSNLGDLIYYLDFGNGARAMIGTTQSPAAAQLTASLVSRCVLSDNRIAAVPSIKAVIKGNALAVTGTAEAIDSTPVTATT